MKIHEMLDKPDWVKLNVLDTKRLKELERFIMNIESIRHKLNSLDEEHLANIRDNGEIIGQILAYRITKEKA